MSFLSEILKCGCKGGPDESYNSKYRDCFLKSDYLVVIVGTITSPTGQDNGFYYSSGSRLNHMYEMLDRYFDGSTNFRELCNNKQFDDVKKMLIKKGIIFLDTVSSCHNDKNSFRDDDLTSIKLDYDTFRDAKPGALLIADSRNAYYSLLKIAHENHLENKIVFCPIFRRGYCQKQWEEVLSEGGIEK